jgi:predicted lipase
MTARRKQRVLNLHNGDDSKATLEDALHQACSIENPDTDTQAGLFLDASSRKLVVSFRGTEQAKLRDLLTDINFLQTAFYGGTDQSSPFAGIKCHTGFLSAYLSVRSAVLQLLETALALDYPDSGAPWSVFITGHSLGGALATLLLFDLEMLRGHGSGVVGRHSALLKSSEAFVERLQTTLVQCYTFGAPRVGNREFAETLTSLLQARSDVRSLYRVVNKADVVARLPRSSRVNSLVVYEHVGKTGE